MPISTRGLESATNATQNVAQLIAQLSAQQGQAVGGLNRGIAGIDEALKQRTAAQKAEQERASLQQYVEGLMGTEGAQGIPGLPSGEAIPQPAQQSVGPMAPQPFNLAPTPTPTPRPDLSGMSPQVLASLLGDVQSQRQAAASRAFSAQQGALGREHDTSMADRRIAASREDSAAQISAASDRQAAELAHREALAAADRQMKWAIEGGRMSAESAEREFRENQASLDRALKERLARFGGEVDITQSRISAGSRQPTETPADVEAKAAARARGASFNRVTPMQSARLKALQSKVNTIRGSGIAGRLTTEQQAALTAAEAELESFIATLPNVAPSAPQPSPQQPTEAHPSGLSPEQVQQAEAAGYRWTPEGWVQ